MFSTLVLTLRDEGYISDTGDAALAQTQNTSRLLSELITSDVRQTIENAVAHSGLATQV